MRCPDCGREVKDDAAVCRACGFAFDPALLDAPETAPLRKQKSGFTNQHSSVHSSVRPAAPASDAHFVDTAPTDSTEGPTPSRASKHGRPSPHASSSSRSAHGAAGKGAQGDVKSAEEPIDVFATSPGDAPFSDLGDDDHDGALSPGATGRMPAYAPDRTVRGPAPDLADVTAEHAATVVHDMASALAAAGLRPDPNAPASDERDDALDALDALDEKRAGKRDYGLDDQFDDGTHEFREIDEGDNEPTTISGPPPTPSSRPRRR